MINLQFALATTLRRCGRIRSVAVAVAVGASISFGSEETWVLLYTTIPHLNLYHYSFPPLSPLLTSLGIFLADTTFPNLSAVLLSIVYIFDSEKADGSQ